MSGTQTPSAPAGTAPPAHLLEGVERWVSRRWVPALINLAALVLLSYGLAQATWRLTTPAGSGGTATDASPAADAGDYNLQTLVSAHLFGEAAPATKPTVSLEAIPLSKLNLALTGVMVTPAGSFALISADGAPEAPFTIGEEISDNVTLYAVYADRVLIHRGTAIESLMLKDSAQSLPNSAIVAPRRRVRRRHVQVQPVGPNSFNVNRAQLTRQMQKPEFLTQALMVPNAGGGFLVRRIKPGSIYQKLGLHVGDVIESVNGQQVNSVEDVMRLYSQLGSASNVQIEVQRAGRNESLTYNLQ